MDGHGKERKRNQRKEGKKVQKSIYQPEEPKHQLQTVSLDELKQEEHQLLYTHDLQPQTRSSHINIRDANKEQDVCN